MKKILCVFLFLIMCACSLAQPIEKSKHQAFQSLDKEKLRYELLNVLTENAKVSLKGKKFCENFVQSKSDTVGRFIAQNLSYYSRERDNSIDTTCEIIKEKNICSILFLADSKGESPWNCGFRFIYDSKKNKIELSSIECIGSC